MTNHHHQSKAEQINNKARKAAPFQFKKMSHEVYESDSLVNSQNKEDMKKRAVRFQEYFIDQNNIY